MAGIDYGALLRVNGKLINKDVAFMESSDTGYICKEATSKDGSIDVDGNYFVYAGDESFLVVFYKTYFHVIIDNKIVYFYVGSNFVSEEFTISGHTIKVDHLDKNYHYVNDYPRMNDSTFNILKEVHGIKYTKRKMYRMAKRRKRSRSYCLSDRFISWVHNGNKYECIFGYGIDSSLSVWKEICQDYDYGYEFSEIEINKIDSWFGIKKRLEV